MKHPIKSILFALCVLLILKSYSQVTFIKQFDFGGDESATSIKQTSDGGYIFTGWKNNALLLGKLDEYSDPLWNKSLFMLSGIAGYDLIIADNGDYVVAGVISDLNYNADLFLARFNTYGDTIWTRRFGGMHFEVGWGLCKTNDGGFIATGQTMSICDSNELYIVRVDSIGNLIWEKTYCNIGLGWGNKIIRTIDNNYAIAGLNGSKNWLIKIDSFGDTLWTKSYGNASYGAWDIVQNPDESYVLTGGGILKTDMNGNLIWLNQNGLGAISLTHSNDNGFVGVTYRNAPFTWDQYLYLIKTDSYGDSVWSRIFGYNQSAWGYDIEKTTDNGFIICGRIDLNHDGSMDVYIIKTDENGVVVGEEEIENNIEVKIQIIPNPNDGSMQLEYVLTENQTGVFEMYDFTGRKVFDMELKQSSGKADISAMYLSRGVYMYRLVSGGVSLDAGKVVVIK